MLLLSLAGVARAEDWTLQESASASVGYTDNPRLLPESSAKDEVGIAGASASLRRETEDSILQLSPRINSMQYRTLNELDNTSGSLALDWQRVTPRTAWFANANGAVDSTLTSELGLSGISDVNKQRQSLTLGAGGTLNWSELNQLGFQLSGARIHYKDAATTGLSSYGYVSALLNPSWAVGALSHFTLSAQGDALKSDSVATQQRDYALNLGFDHQRNERNKWHIRLGASGVDEGGSLKLGWVLDGGWTWQGERASLGTTLQRKIAPVGNGLLARTDTWSLDLERTMSEHSMLSVQLGVTRSASIAFSSFVLYGGSLWSSVAAQWRWQFRPDWFTALRASDSSVRYGLSDGPWAHGWDARWSIDWQADQK